MHYDRNSQFSCKYIPFIISSHVPAVAFNVMSLDFACFDLCFKKCFGTK
ncbi:hypothetical protein IHE45_17G060000 [Dioscorea alata]|uniref:Uncharacterized protein n=1 Tax=Dioscorea alata TaxID=55571 RepID=A0ACB7UCG7_DIOAL|nr:hypothetical protein IHE45_17G060000 [Dioscorea alata]